MRNIALARQRIVRGFAGELARIRIWLSATDGNQEVVDRLRGESGEVVLARLTDTLLRELGHETQTPVEDAAAHVRRAITGVPQSLKGEPDAARSEKHNSHRVRGKKSGVPETAS